VNLRRHRRTDHARLARVCDPGTSPELEDEMTIEADRLAPGIPRVAHNRGLFLLRRVRASHAAWRERHHIRNLDAAALRDVGLTGAQQHSVTVAEIVKRMERGV
jgi:hypothetical protein